MELWQQSFAGSMPLSKDIDWRKIAHDHTPSGAAIANVLRYCCLQALKREKREIALADIVAGIKKEQHKEGVIF